MVQVLLVSTRFQDLALCPLLPSWVFVTPLDYDVRLRLREKDREKDWEKDREKDRKKDREKDRHTF
jgi:hypothetical protein